MNKVSKLKALHRLTLVCESPLGFCSVHIHKIRSMLICFPCILFDCVRIVWLIQTLSFSIYDCAPLYNKHVHAKISVQLIINCQAIHIEFSKRSRELPRLKTYKPKLKKRHYIFIFESSVKSCNHWEVRCHQ